MKDPSLSRRRRIRFKLLVSFNGAFRRRPPSRKLRYVGGETRIISVERNTSLQILKSKIAHLICPSFDFVKFCLKYHVSESFCGDNGEQEGPVLGLLESNDDLRCMIEEYETMELEGKLRTRVWIFVCNANDGFDDPAFVDNYSGDCFCGKNNGFVKPAGAGSVGDDKRKSENLFVLSNKYDNKSNKKLGDDSLRKMVLKQQLLAKNLNGVRTCCGSGEQSDTELASQNGISQSPLKQLCSEVGSRWSSESKNLNFARDPYTMNVFDDKPTNGPIVNIEGSGKILPVAESNSDPLNSKDGNSHVRCRGSNLLGQSCIFFGNQNGHYMLSSNEFVAAEKTRSMPFNSSISWMANGLDPNCELGIVDLASLQNIDRETIVPQCGDCNMVKRGLVPPTCNYPLGSGTYTMESLQITGSQRKACGGCICNHYLLGSGAYPTECLQSTGSQWRVHGGCIRNHIFGPIESRNQRACLYHISTRSNASELGIHQNFRLDGKAWRGRFYLRLRSSSNLPNQGPPSRSQSAALGENSLDMVGMGGQTPLDHAEEPPSKNQSSSLHSPCESIVTELSNENKLLDVEGSHETLDIHQESNKELRNNGASVVYLSQHDGSEHISETSPKPQSNGLDLMDVQHINLGSNEISSGISSDSSSYNVLKCDDDDDKREAVQHSQKSDSSSAEKDKNKNTSSCLKGNNGMPADIIALYAHLATKELQIIKNADLEYIKELGHGTYGTVYHGKWKGTDVAIKRIKPSCFSNGAKEEQLVADFWKEAHTLGQLHHPNIVALYGVVIDGPVNCLATVAEYMVNGSLKQVLHRKDRTIDRRKRMIIAMDAAFGMEYLHGKNIVHFDLKSHNFLVNMRDPQRPVCKIGDLGLSKIKQRTLVSGGIRGTIPWMAPELLSGRKLVSEKVDVFSFGIVMWELLTCEEPYANMRSEEIIAGIIRGNLRPEIPSWCDPSWRSLMERCWSSNPDCRPSFSEIAKELRAMAAPMNIK